MSELNRGHLLTELANPLSQELDQLSTDALVELFCRNDLEPQRAVQQAAPQLAQAIEAIARLLRQGGELGKRLDFLIQELHREANTLGSKSAALELTGISVEMKVLIEQMREQVQNIE